MFEVQDLNLTPQPLPNFFKDCSQCDFQVEQASVTPIWRASERSVKGLFCKFITVGQYNIQLSEVKY